LGRFVSADSIVPEPGNPQSLNRYSYVNDRPTVLVDPTGHIAWVPFLAAGGAVLGASLYIGTGLVSGRFQNISVSEFAVELGASIVVGAVGGALIGGGITAGAGVAAFAMIGAGTGVVGSEIGYQLTAGADFKTEELVANASISGVSGAVSGMVGAPSFGASAVASTSARILVSGAAGAAQYSVTQGLNGREITGEGLAMSTAVGLGAGVLGEVLPGIKYNAGKTPESQIVRYAGAASGGINYAESYRHFARQVVARNLVVLAARDTVRTGFIETATNAVGNQIIPK
ncbi:MAG: hypothetical protein RMK99_09635, partial [Anaerolineales bacterium]|nr:hypothetical protein [Anaerolineales bacterium]